MEAELKLSPRQLEILELLVSGVPQKQLPYALSLSRHTVDHYLRAIRARYRVQSTLQAVVTFLTAPSTPSRISA